MEIVNPEKYIYIMTYSFPCQDLSVAGKRKGMAKGKQTRSGLLWEVERLLNEVENLPQILLMENVPMIHSQDNIKDFALWIDFLRDKGYSNYWQDLNAKGYGIPQNRNRCFMISILGDYSYTFPEPMPLKTVVRDYLEKEVDEKYYLNNAKAKELIEKLTYKDIKGGDTVDGTINNPQKRQVSNCITARYDCGISNQAQVGLMVIDETTNKDRPNE